ncbi:LOW QUALITY PROTEIN: zinc finger CCHC-type and RNA-binding motif-containing protein 1 [Lethenteron reissneri]|uniref:LOW QUALITY PROTEIN: zinc finger CCHC-type and RNA-binding motif-containing protein 1 n=1 Tax=Lethenteron reissneri TaxID=7753 RepID=UPI002AB6C754|nr:LOW QUALITY PROTEIN: zinc finger CCHC-type and RNA-binding motif-containing protein 1 [Lethenteron reissneri]
MSGGLAPSRSTVYVSNLPFSLTNSDLHKIMEKHGKVVRVTVVRDRETRRSKGVAFVLFLDRESAQNCSRKVNNKELFGRTLKASIAVDNGRASEFIRRRTYTDKSRCYECGEDGHLSYICPKNVLGERDPPKKKEKKKKKKLDATQEQETNVSGSEEEGEDPALDSLSQAIAFQHARVEEERRHFGGGGNGGDGQPGTSDADGTRHRIKQSHYFSDEEELSD